MQNQFIKVIAGILLCCFLFPITAFAESARQMVQSGNNAYLAGDYKKSFEEYDKASAAEPDSPVILFNKGNALYKQGAYDEAVKTYEQAAIQSIQKGNQALEAKNRFNMGNSTFRQAEILRSTDLQKSFEVYEQSAENYQAALQISPELFEAGHNLEIARQAANQILNEIKMQEKQQQQIWDHFGGSVWEISNFLGNLLVVAKDGKITDDDFEKIIHRKMLIAISRFREYAQLSQQKHKLFIQLNKVIKNNNTFL